ncbi:MAG: 3'(2'),5'-bisphosphate nucleotidase CysQ [Myxococcales bacterium]|nr:3'(2'),5'-bisphosphate nucleotidase CysQ [Myxococcales bacterium]MCB9701992.1 3'(2'),5'-bisphosphate nucleotidase CysQ [Myxococcales bacterium]
MSLARELDVALDLARQCGVIALDLQRRGPSALATRDKGDGEGPVTRADTELNARLVAALEAAFPGDTIVAEESAAAGEAARRRARRCWFIDPIDGTSEYARGEDEWAIHIGLCVDGEPALGVVHEPARARLSWGTCLDEHVAWGEAAGGRARRLHTAATPPGALRLVSSKSHASPKILEVMGALGIPPERNLRIGSTGVKMMTIAWGEADLYVHPRAGTKLWDTGAPHAILKAAGGAVSDLRGDPLRYRGAGIGNDAGVLAVGGHHQAIASRLRHLADAWLPRPETNT